MRQIEPRAPLPVPAPVLDAVAQLVGFERPSGGDPPPPWAELRAFLMEQRCWALLAQPLFASDWAYGEEEGAELADEAMKGLTSSMMLDRALLLVAAPLQRAGIDWAATKGLAFAEQLWLMPGRTYSDVDIVIGRSQLSDAADILEELGGQRHLADPRSHVTQRFGKGVAYSLRHGEEIDVHLGLCDGPFLYRMSEDDMFGSLDRISVGGRGIPTLSREALFLHACYHAALPEEHRRLVPLVDVAMGLCNPAVSADRVLDLARRWDAEVVVAAAIQWSRASLQIPCTTALAKWADEFRPRWRTYQWFRSYHWRSSRRYLATTLANVDAQPCWSDRFEYASLVARGDPADSWVSRFGRVRSRLASGSGRSAT